MWQSEIQKHKFWLLTATYAGVRTVDKVLKSKLVRDFVLSIFNLHDMHIFKSTICIIL